MNNLPYGLRLRPSRPSLRVSLESLGFARDPELAVGQGAKGTVSKPATKNFLFAVGAYSPILEDW